MPLVIFFQGEGSQYGDNYLTGKDIAELSTSKATFIRVPFTSNREADPWAEESVVPTSKLLSKNPSLAYDISVGKPTFIVADWHGNEYFRMTKKPKAKDLERYLDKIEDEVEDKNKKLQKYLDKAIEEKAEKDTGKAVKYLLKNFKEDVVGLEAMEGSIRLYHEIIEDARKVKEGLVKEGGEKGIEGLKELAKDFKKTDFEKEIDEAIEQLKSPVTQD